MRFFYLPASGFGRSTWIVQTKGGVTLTFGTPREASPIGGADPTEWSHEPLAPASGIGAIEGKLSAVASKAADTAVSDVVATAIDEAGQSVSAALADGTATVFQYGTSHASILVRFGDEALHTEQVLTDVGTTIAERASSDAATRSVQIALPNGQAALAYQRSIVGTCG